MIALAHHTTPPLFSFRFRSRQKEGASWLHDHTPTLPSPCRSLDLGLDSKQTTFGGKKGKVEWGWEHLRREPSNDLMRKKNGWKLGINKQGANIVIAVCMSTKRGGHVS